jgi:squalene cyclase
MLKRLHIAVTASFVGAALLAGIVFTAPASAQSVANATSRALTYFHQNQLATGGFRAANAWQTASMTPWVVQAIVAAGQSPSTFKKPGGKSPITYLQSVNIDSQATSGAGTTSNPADVYAKMIMAYRAANVPSLISRAGSKRINLVSRLLLYRNSQSGAFTTARGGSGTYAAISTTTWAILGLKAAGLSTTQIAKSVSWLRGRQAANGGFAFMPGGSPDTDSTAAAVQALRAGGVSASSTTIKRALVYLRNQQKGNGGFTAGSGSTTNAESTALTIQAIRAAGQNPSASSWKKSGNTPISFLLSLQARSGAFYHYGTTLAMPLVTTSQVVVALRGKTYPF